MKVAYIANWLNRKPFDETDSSGLFIKEQVRAMQDLGIEAALLFPDLMPRRAVLFSPKNSWHTEGGIPICRREAFCPPKWSPILLRYWISRAVRVYDDYVQRFGKPDLIHAHNYWSGFVAQAIYQKHGIPYVLTEHDIAFLEKNGLRTWLKPFLTRLMNEAHQTVAVSTGLKKCLEPFCDKPIRVIPNIIDTRFFTAKELKAQAVQPKRFVSIGTLTAFKHYRVLIPAFAAFLREHPQLKAELQIIGSGEEYAILQNLIMALGLSGQIHLLGQQSKAAVRDILQRADVFVSSSRVETFGVAMAEAMAVGLPILASPTVGAQEILTDKTGWICADFSEAAIQRGLEKMVLNYPYFQPSVIRQHVIERFSAEKVAAAYSDIYQAV
jgi:glycosyltransferase involved in cell wall biosynthesis